MSFRIIPRLDIKGPNLVKGIHLEGLRVLGQPERFARHYYEQGADELLYMAMMETDLGVHYHAWTLSQARLNLLKRLNISEEEATLLVEDILFYPGQAFSFAPQLLN